MSHLCTNHITAYPTLKLFTADNKGGLLYEGSRDPDSILAFLNAKVYREIRMPYIKMSHVTNMNTSVTRFDPA